MKTRRFISAVALLCLGCGAAAAQTAGGSYRFAPEDGSGSPTEAVWDGDNQGWRVAFGPHGRL